VPICGDLNVPEIFVWYSQKNKKSFYGGDYQNKPSENIDLII